MKNRLLYRIVNFGKGSSYRRAFLVVLVCLPATGIQAAVADTLILDGKVILIEEQVEVDTVWIDPPASTGEKKRSRTDSWQLGFHAGPRISRYRATSQLAGLETLETFLEEKVNVVTGPVVGMEIVYRFEKAIAIRAGLEVGYQGWDAAAFDPRFLNDSLYRFESPEPGSLNQIIRFRYPDLGSETDTLALEWQSGQNRFWSIEVPLMVSYIFPVEEWGRGHYLEAGLGGVSRMTAGWRSSDVILIKQEGEWKHGGNEQFEPNRFWVLGRAELGWYKQMPGNKASWGFRLYFQTPFTPVETMSEMTKIQGVESGLSGYFRFFLNQSATKTP